MSDESELLKKRFVELAKKSYSSSIFVFTDFLGLNEQSLFDSVKSEIRGIPYDCFGGAEGAERIMVRFGSAEELGYEVPYPISVVKISPINAKFADKLTHRDFLGTVLALGIERRCIGDIVIRDNVGYVFVKEDMAAFVADGVIRVKNTDVNACVTDSLPEGALYRTEVKRVQANGERLDAVIAKVFSLSREESSRLFAKGLVYVGGRVTENTSYIPKPGEVISVRGHGRMIYRGYDSLTKKGKKNIAVELYC